MSKRQRSQRIYSYDISDKTKDYIKEKLYELISNVEDRESNYYNYENIIEKFLRNLKENDEGMMNRCTSCGEDMGRTNPRQLCGKIYCYNEL